MNTDAKRRPRQRDRILTDARQRQEEALDDALKNTFPASDPISIEQPGRRPGPGGPLTEKNNHAPFGRYEY